MCVYTETYMKTDTHTQTHTHVCSKTLPPSEPTSISAVVEKLNNSFITLQTATNSFHCSQSARRSSRTWNAQRLFGSPFKSRSQYLKKNGDGKSNTCKCTYNCVPWTQVVSFSQFTKWLCSVLISNKPSNSWTYHSKWTSTIFFFMIFK